MTSRRGRFAALLAVALAAGEGWASAQGAWSFDRLGTWKGEEETGWKLAYAAGYAVPENSDSAAMEAAASFQTSLEYQAYRLAAAGLEFGYTPGHKLKGTFAGRYRGDVDGDGVVDALRFNSDIKVKVLQLTPFLRIGGFFAGKGHVRLKHYVVVGGGYYRREWNDGTFSLFGAGSSGASQAGREIPYFKGSSDHAGIQFGTGLELQLLEAFSVGADIRYHNLFDAQDDIRYIVPGARFTFRF